MGLLLQKTNIIRDYREDTDEQRFFWPREIWGKYGFSEMKDMYAPEAAEQAQWVQSHMVLDALRHTIDALDYLRFLKNQSVFNFVAIPATMAIATLELCFMNPTMFQRNIKIRKAEAASLIMRSTNPREIGLIFREYSRKIHAKAVPSDPNYIKLAVACGRIEQWYQHNYPSFVQVVDSGNGPKAAYDETDARSRVLVLEQEQDKAMAAKRRVDRITQKAQNGANGAVNNYQDTSVKELIMYMAAAMAVLVGFCGISIYLVVHFFDEPDTGSFSIPNPSQVVGKVVEVVSFGTIKARTEL
ncbi:hypothetical protein NMY22_g9834 [Coprinellus aureogranulatus]|nr:hypothetical protein NMY22_g9834 [Coprinellus aureogranulatus]